MAGGMNMGKKHKRGNKGHAAGGKVTSKHSTMIPAAEKVVVWLRRDARVKRVVLGLIKVIGNGPPRISTKSINGGFELTVRGNKSLQKIKVYTDAFCAVSKDLRRKFNAN